MPKCFVFFSSLRAKWMWFFFIKLLEYAMNLITNNFRFIFFALFYFQLAHSLWSGEWRKKVIECVRIFRNFVPSRRAIQTVRLQPKTFSKEKVKIAWEVTLLGLFKTEKTTEAWEKNAAHKNWWGRNNNYWTKFYRRCHTAEPTKELLLRTTYYGVGIRI